MIDTIATQAGPVVRQVGAKAAELAAVAADRAGPIAHRAADATADAGVQIAERSRTWAAELRSKTGETSETESGYGGSSGASTAVLEGADDAVERAAKDDPAEGPRQ
jgi:ABC-type sulfate transport system substrate-binding protein